MIVLTVVHVVHPIKRVFIFDEGDEFDFNNAIDAWVDLMRVNVASRIYRSISLDFSVSSLQTQPEDNMLTFDQLRAANINRLPQFKNSKGGMAHSKPDGSDWKLSAWSNATLGELGEAANIIKKIERGDMSLEDARVDLAKELADVATYLDILAFQADIDLGEAVRHKFNEVSIRVGATTRL